MNQRSCMRECRHRIAHSKQEEILVLIAGTSRNRENPQDMKQKDCFMSCGFFVRQDGFMIRWVHQP